MRLQQTLCGARRWHRLWLYAAWIVLLASCPAAPQTDGPHPGPIQFTNVTAAAGIKFVNYRGNDGIAINREIFGPGVCVADFDGDGLEDIYFVNGRDLYHRGVNVRNALYRNNGDGTFTDVTDKAGVPGTGYGMGCVWGDYNNSGFPSLFVTQYGRNVLYRNNGDGTFTDVTDKAKVAGTESGTLFHSGAVFFDYDRDRLLDLGFVGNVECLVADAEHLPFDDNSFDCVTIGFGLRNVTDKDAALRSMHRVLKPGGQLLVLEFSTPAAPISTADASSTGSLSFSGYSSTGPALTPLDPRRGLIK